jgi:bifunctional non-homologous end joining protein LigD
MLPQLRDRPLNLERFPSGIGKPGFFQQEMPKQAPDWLGSVSVRKEGGRVRHVVASGAAALVYLANQSCVTLHAWLSRRDRLEHPDQLIFDLDPPDQRPRDVAAAARALGRLLRELGLTPFIKTTGSRGYHVLVPLDRRQTYDVVREFAREVAEELVRRHPSELTLEARKQSRRGRIYVDIMRNSYAHTAVPPYTVRARRGAPVATPIAWEELEDPAMHPARFGLRDIPARLESVPDPWKDLRRRVKPLGAAIEALHRPKP